MTATLSSEAVEWLVHGEHGLSSECIFHVLVLGESGRGRWGWGNYPHDPSDFIRCERLLRAVPGLRERLPEMAEVAPVWAALVPRWPEIVALLIEEAGSEDDAFGYPRSGSAPRSYALMEGIIDVAEGRAAVARVVGL